MKKKFFAACILVLAVFGCTNNKFETGQKLLKNKQYAAAIEYFDDYLFEKTDSVFVSKNRNGAIQTKVELERSKAYYELGLLAFKNKSWQLANRMFFLANSQKADEALDNSYHELIKIAKQNNNTEEVLKYYNYIITHLTTSELIPEFLYDRILINLHKYQLDELAWADYIKLYETYPKNHYVKKAQKEIDSFLNNYINDAVAMKNLISKEVALERLFELNKYPSSFNHKITKEIALTYFEIAVEYSKNNEHNLAKQNFEIALKYDKNLKQEVKRQQVKICSIFIENAQKLISQKKPDEAIASYKKCFIYIPNYEPAQNAINNAIDYNKQLLKAEELALKAQKLAKQKQNKKALAFYKQSYALHKNAKVKKQIFLLNNLIKIKQNPTAFALEIIKTAKNNYIPKTIKKLEDKLEKLYGKEGIKTTDFKVLFSLGKDKYEVRYDIISPDETYFFVWQVNLQTRQIFPLNKKTEKTFEKAYK